MTCTALGLLLACWSCAAQSVDLSPTAWGEEELARVFERNGQVGDSAVAAEGEQMMIVGTTGAPAVRAGMEALRQGGHAVDAVLTTALGEICLAGGSWVSYAGLLTMVVYEAETGEVHSMNAAFDIPAFEDDPASIPALGSGVPSGRTALVPGFMAGVQSAHDRFGKLPFEEIFAPAIHFADEGFEIPGFLGRMIEDRRDVLARLPEAKRVFTKEDGSFYAAGDHFRQPELAHTLRMVASDGAAYMYDGPWAERFVEIVEREGGRMTLEDLRTYQPIWAAPVRTTFGDYEVYSQGLPAHGGVNAIECLNLIEASNLAAYGHPSESAEAFFWLSQLTNLMGLSYLTPEITAFVVPDEEVTLESRLTKGWAERIWERMRAGELPLTVAPAEGTHSDAVVAIDRWGNAAAIVHSINTVTWGETGIFVDGISIPDAAAFQQAPMAQAGAGNRLPDPTNPLLVLRDGRPYVVSSSIGAGLHHKSVQCLLNVLAYDMDPAAAIDAPEIMLPEWNAMGRATARTAEGAFSPELIEAVRAMGQPVKVLAPDEQRMARGYWVGIRIDPETGRMSGAASAIVAGYALGE